MVLFGSVAAAVVSASSLAAWSWLRGRRSMPAGSIGLIALGICAAAVAIELYFEWIDDKRAASAARSIAWPLMEPLPMPPPAPAAAAGAVVQAAPVESLIGGLEARLAAEPDDPAGWALLAQSYAFVANREGAETAVQRAVELGADENTLRERVRSAGRTATPVDWVEETLRTTRERRLRAAGEAR